MTAKVMPMKKNGKKSLVPLDESRRPMLISKVLAKAWEDDLSKLIPPETHPDDVKTYKRFFFAGARAVMFDLCFTDALEDGMEATPEDLSKVDAILHEVNEFFCEVQAGRQ